MVGNIGSGRLLQRGVAPSRLLTIGFVTMALSATATFAGNADAGLAPVLRYGAVLLFSSVGGLIPATLFALAVRLAPSERTLSTTVGWVQQWSALGQFAAAALVAAGPAPRAVTRDLGGYGRLFGRRLLLTAVLSRLPVQPCHCARWQQHTTKTKPAVRQPTWASLIVWIAAIASLYVINRNFWALAAPPLIFVTPRLSIAMPRVRSVFLRLLSAAPAGALDHHEALRVCAAALEWIGALLGLLGAFLLATHTSISRYGWLAFLGANVAMTGFAVAIGAHGLLVQQVRLTATTLLCLRRSGLWASKVPPTT